MTAAGQTIWSTAANTFAAVPAAVYCTADYVATGSLATITGMSWTVNANEIWSFSGLFYNTVTGSGLAHFQWSLPASATIFYHIHLSAETVDTQNNADTTQYTNSFTNNPEYNFFGSTGAAGMVPVWGVVTISSTAGTVSAQTKLSGGTSFTTKKGSFLHLTRLA